MNLRIPKISICIPARSGEEFIGTAIEPILAEIDNCNFVTKTLHLIPDNETP